MLFLVDLWGRNLIGSFYECHIEIPHLKYNICMKIPNIYSVRNQLFHLNKPRSVPSLLLHLSSSPQSLSFPFSFFSFVESFHRFSVCTNATLEKHPERDFLFWFGIYWGTALVHVNQTFICQRKIQQQHDKHVQAHNEWTEARMMSFARTDTTANESKKSCCLTVWKIRNYIYFPLWHQMKLQQKFVLL